MDYQPRSDGRPSGGRGIAGSATVDVRPAIGARGIRTFIDVPHRVHRGDPAWVAPLNFERNQFLDTRRNPYFGHAEAAFWVAWRDGRPVGRISAQIDRLEQERSGPDIGHFGMLSAIDDRAVFAALLGEAEAWLAGRGVRRVTGPFSLSINQESGLLVDGFQTPPMLMMPHDPQYAAGHLEALGYGGARDLFAYAMDFASGLPESVRTLAARATSPDLTIRPLDLSRYDDEITTITSIFNQAWRDNWGFVPLNAAQARHFGRELRPLVRPDLVTIAELDGAPVGFIMCLPDLNEAIRDLNGRLWPTGWAKLAWRLKAGRVTRARVALMGIVPDAIGNMRAGLLVYRLICSVERALMKAGIRTVEMSWILEDNHAMRRVLEPISQDIYKTFRVYEKAIALDAVRP